MKKYINFSSYIMGKEEERELIDTLYSGWLTTGPKTEIFEDRFAAYSKAKYAVAVSSGTAALHLSLLASGITKNDEVITTPMTFVATVNAILYVGARPVLADVEPDTLNIDPDEIKKKINKNTKAVIVVHYAGQPCRMQEILKIAENNNLFLIEDAAHAIEAKYKGKKIGCIGDLTCFSFHPIKNITTGEGGMVTTNSRKLADKVKILRLHGMDKSAWRRYAKNGFRHWDMRCLGYKYNMTDIQASLGIHQLKRIGYFWRRRKELTVEYDHGFRETEDIILLPQQQKGNKNSFNLYPIRIKTENLKVKRDKLISKLQSKGVGIGVHFRAIHLLSFFKKLLGLDRGSLPNSEYASDRLISLPLYPKMVSGQVGYVIDCVKTIISEAK